MFQSRSGGAATAPEVPEDGHNPHPYLHPTKMEAKEEAEEMEAVAGAESTPGTSGEFIEKPIHISVSGKMKMYKCGNCDITPK